MLFFFFSLSRPKVELPVFCNRFVIKKKGYFPPLPESKCLIWFLNA